MICSLAAIACLAFDSKVAAQPVTRSAVVNRQSSIVNAEPSALQASFLSPPASARPHTWWHWMDGNITKEGITADLESMKEAGIGGAHIFDVGQGVPAGNVNYNTPEWRELMTHAMAEAKRLGLEMTMHNCAGWSSSGAPWVQPEDAMKKVVWSSIEFEGSGKVAKPLPKPQTVRSFYQDIAVFAFATPAPGDAAAQSRRPALTGLDANPGKVDSLKWPVIDKPISVPLAALNEDGTLDLSLPEGKWTILRIGYTLTGAQNVATRQSGLGLEVDKLSSESLDRFIDGGLTPLFDRMGPLVGNPFTTVLVDSYETGYNNWTPKIIAEFKARRGYDASRYLPALAGYSIGNDEQTLRFLFDYRRTIAELWAKNYSTHFADRLKAKGLQLAIEPYGNGNFDPFSYAKPAGLIMGEYWVGDGVINPSVKHAASVAHVYGHSVVGAEGLTATPSQAGFRNQPRQWKPFADRGFTTGINRIIYHRFAHQPWVKDVLPGMTMGPWGSHVDRTETFWSFMPDWDRYLSRCQFMLQSGVFVGDICLFPGEDAPQSYAGEGADLPAIPKGYDFDFCGTDPLMSLQVRNGQLVLPNGGKYRVLALPNTDKMTIPLANKIRSLVAAGATVLGPKPTRSPSLSENGAAYQSALDKIANDVWGPGSRPAGTHAFGKGRVYWGMPLQKVLTGLGVTPDFSTDAKGISTIHRRIGGTDSYFVASAQALPRTVSCHFRVTGMIPELWHAETGRIEDAPVWRSTKDGVEIPLSLDSDGSVFVIFRRPNTQTDSVAGVDADVRAVGSKPLPLLKIIKAEYGALDQAGKFKDVTAIVAGAASKHSLQVGATNGDMGGDPAYNIVKDLRVTYEMGGVRKTVTVRENEVLSIGTVADPGTPPAYQIHGVGNERQLDVWQRGSYKIKWASGKQSVVTETSLPVPVEIRGPWTTRFPAGWSAPPTVTFNKLMSWSEHPEFGIRYFSGTVSYTKKIQVPAGLLGAGKRLYLDLGDVREFARVRLNGKLLANLWKPPFRIDITNAAKAGENDLQVEVTNLWVNRLIGDEQFPDDMGWAGERLSKWPDWFVKGEKRPQPGRKTFTTWRHNRKDTPLLPSGLLGPVVLRPVKVVQVLR
jgi:hypothetical protein